MEPIFSHLEPAFFADTFFDRLFSSTYMIRKAIILLSLCCAVLCAFVGYLSYDVTQESNKAAGEAISVTCEETLKSPPTQTSRFNLTEFAAGKHVASLDNDGDENWDRLCVPFFPRKRQRIGHAYCAVLVCFKDVPTRTALEQIIEGGNLDLNYWPERQELDRALHSQLAQRYTNMDLAKSPILHFGYEAGNPILGESTLLASVGAGSVALFVAFLAMVAGFIVRKKPQSIDINTEDQPTTNRAGLPVDNSPSIFDQVTSLRTPVGE